MRTTVEENVELGRSIGEKLADAGPTTVVMLPKRGLSALDREGQPFDDPKARRALYAAIQHAIGTTSVVELDLHINDAALPKRGQSAHRDDALESK